MPHPRSARHAARSTILCLTLTAVGATVSAAPWLLHAPWRGFDTGYYPAPFGPTDMALGDLDGDGDVDALVACSFWAGPGIAVLRNAGDGSFGAPETYLLSSPLVPGRVALSDVDADGDLDALSTIPDDRGGTNLVAMWRNNGDGTLAFRELFSTGDGPVGLAVGDFDGDLVDDLVTADYGDLGRGTTASLLRHNGLTGAAARFEPAVSWTVGGGPFDVVAGDLDGDGDLDLLIARENQWSNIVGVWLNDGTGSFTVSVEYDVGDATRPVVGLSDLDWDGDLDFVTTYTDGGGAVVLVHRNAGDATFVMAEEYPLDAWSPSVRRVAFGDLNGDRYPDIVTANPNGRSSEGWRTLLSDGRRWGFLESSWNHSAQNTEVVAVADVDADGDLDVLSLARFSAEITVSLNPGTGIFHKPSAFPVPGIVRAIDAADVDIDGHEDIVVSSNALIHTLRNDGSGRFAPYETYDPPISFSGFKLRDLNGDTWPDLMVVGADFATSLNDGNGNFDAGTHWTFGHCGSWIDAFDLDGDGDRDVVSTDCGGFPYEIFIAENAGDATFTDVAPLSAFSRMNQIEAADLNNDGRLDLVTNIDGYGLSAHLGNGDLTFQPEIVSGTPAYRFTLVELTGDAFLDAAIVVSAGAFGTDQVGVAAGNGDGTFQEATLYFASSVLENLRVAVDLDTGDVDCDGVPDVIVTNYASNDVSVFLNPRDGTLAPQSRYGAGTTPLLGVVGDFTGDSVNDVGVISNPLVAGLGSDAFMILPGLCGGCGVPDDVPPDQGNRLRAVRDADDVAVSWPGAPAVAWRVYRDPRKTALGRTALVPDAAIESFVDVGGVPGPALYHYQIKGLSPCTSTPGP